MPLPSPPSPLPTAPGTHTESIAVRWFFPLWGDNPQPDLGAVCRPLPTVSDFKKKSHLSSYTMYIINMILIVYNEIIAISVTKSNLLLHYLSLNRKSKIPSSLLYTWTELDTYIPSHHYIHFMYYNNQEPKKKIRYMYLHLYSYTFFRLL